MFYFSPVRQKMRILPFMALAALLIPLFLLNETRAEEGGRQIVAISSRDIGDQTEVRIKGSGPLTTTIYELPSPPRIIIDIAEAKAAGNMAQEFNSKNKLSFKTSEIQGAKSPITRFELLLSGAFTYTTSQDGNDVVILIKNGSEIPAVQGSPGISTDSQANASDEGQISSVINQKKDIDKQLPSINPLGGKSSLQRKEQQMEDAFNFSGYKRERISVEFQKMDLHNVFNFLRQVSGVNIVVDESVQGALTLVLDDVPWDFALDVILNLKDLEKEEKFNTLVIYPKGKGFNWPNQAQNNLSFEADAGVVRQEALVIQQQDMQSPQIVEAKQKIALAREAEKREDYETAIYVYEQAFEEWPKNSKLATRISSIYLTQLRQNAKALYYAQKALAIDKKNHAAALNAAIASANMQERSQAIKYFDQSINAKKPSSEALLSYAAFSEEQHEYAGALKILAKHSTLYGNDLDAMVSVARIYDKMGDRQKASESYRAVLSSGFQIPPDLVKYINGRLALK